MISHASRFGLNMMYPILVALIITVAFGSPSALPDALSLRFPGLTEAMWLLGAKVAALSALYLSLKLILFGYQLHRIKKLSALACYPLVLLVDTIVTSIVRPILVDALLEWSVKWDSRKNQTLSFKALRKVVNRVDPLYPTGDELSSRSGL